MPSVQFKTVQVKQIDDSQATQMRRSSLDQSIRLDQSTRSMTGGDRSMTAGSMSGGDFAQSSGEALPMRAQTLPAPILPAPNLPALQIMGACVESRLDSSEVPAEFIDLARGDAMDQFVEAATALPAEFVVSVIEEIRTVTPALVTTCTESPKEFWQCFGLLWQLVMRLLGGSKEQGAAISLLEALGAGMAERDSMASLGMLEDYALPKMVKGLKASPQVVSIVYAFTAPQAYDHIKAIRKLQVTHHHDTAKTTTTNTTTATPITTTITTTATTTTTTTTTLLCACSSPPCSFHYFNPFVGRPGRRACLHAVSGLINPARERFQRPAAGLVHRSRCHELE
jgi:hypothetical protein